MDDVSDMSCMPHGSVEKVTWDVQEEVLRGLAEEVSLGGRTH